MTGKHRNLVLKPGYTYSVGTKLRLEGIVKENKETLKHIVRVSAKKGNVNDVYILYGSEPKSYLGQLIEVERVEKDFMRNVYYLRPVGELGKAKHVS
ncbi:MAG: hypothetical protein QW404_01555 [Candidatus Nanoarchaeia archaeon]